MFVGERFFNSMAKPEIIEAYVDAVKKEIRKVIPLINKSRKISQIHYGGGSPSSIPLHYIQEINELLLSNFECIDSPEIAIECHPGYLDENNWMQLINAGFNRCSIGVQDFNSKVLKGVNRRPSLLEMETIFGLLRAFNVSINMAKSPFLEYISARLMYISGIRFVLFANSYCFNASLK